MRESKCKPALSPATCEELMCRSQTAGERWCESPFFLSWGCWFQIPPQPLVEEAPSIPTPFWQLGSLRTQLGLVHLIGRLKAIQGPWQKLQNSLQISEQRLEGFPILTSILPLLIVHRPRGGWGVLSMFPPRLPPFLHSVYPHASLLSSFMSLHLACLDSDAFKDGLIYGRK